MADRLSYENKVAITPRETHKNQIWDVDMNDIKNVANSHADELESLLNGDGKTYESTADAMAVLPLPSNNTPFTIRNSISEDGYYIYLSSEGGGYKFLGDLIPEVVSELVTQYTVLGITWNDFTFKTLDETHNFTENTTSIPINSVKYLGFKVWDLQPILLDRPYSEGVVYVAKITTDGTDITELLNFEHRLNKSSIEAFKNKLKENIQVNIAILGDSLLEPAGSGTKWTDLLFDVTYVADGYNVPNVNNVNIDNYAVGGQTSHYGLIYSGKGTRSNTGNNNNTSVSYDANEQMEVYVPADISQVGKSPILTGKYDLIIIGFGANGGTYNLGYYEALIKSLRDHNIDVLILTQNYRSDNATYRYSTGEQDLQFAQQFGCSIADTWSFVKEKEENGGTVFADTIHMAQDGQDAYADSIRSVLSENKIDSKVITKSFRTHKEISDSNLSFKFPNTVNLQMPFSHNGTEVATAMDDLINPVVQFFGIDSSVSVINLAVGERADFSHDFASAFDVIIERNCTFTANITRANGTSVIGTISNVPSGVLPGVLEGVNIGVYTNITEDLLSNKGIQIIVTSGTMKLMCASFITYKNDTVLFKDISFFGTWNEESFDFGVEKVKYSDVVDDYFNFEYNGSGALVLLNRNTASGIFDIYIDGKIHTSDFDMYSASRLIQDLYISHLSDNRDGNENTKHTITFHLKGLGGISIGVTPGLWNRRMSISSIKSIQRD